MKSENKKEKYYGQIEQDDKINEDFRNLHKELVDRVAQFFNEHDIVIDDFSLSADGFAESCKHGEWVSATDSGFSCRKYSDKFKDAFWDCGRKFTKEELDELEKEAHTPYIYSM